MDFASGSFDAVKRATELSEEVNRLRPPRSLHSDGVLRPFCLREAEGNKLLKYVLNTQNETIQVQTKQKQAHIKFV